MLSAEKVAFQDGKWTLILETNWGNGRLWTVQSQSVTGPLAAGGLQTGAKVAGYLKQVWVLGARPKEGNDFAQ